MGRKHLPHSVQRIWLKATLWAKSNLLSAVAKSFSYWELGEENAETHLFGYNICLLLYALAVFPYPFFTMPKKQNSQQTLCLAGVTKELYFEKQNFLTKVCWPQPIYLYIEPGKTHSLPSKHGSEAISFATEESKLLHFVRFRDKSLWKSPDLTPPPVNQSEPLASPGEIGVKPWKGEPIRTQHLTLHQKVTNQTRRLPFF